MTKRWLCALLAVAMLVCLIPTTEIHAHAASNMKASDQIIAYLKSMEGFAAVPFWDYGQWTVGYGNRCPDDKLDRYLAEGIPLDEAEALFRDHLTGFEKYVNLFIDRYNLTFTQGQFDAVLSISYNCGAGWLYEDSQLLNAIVNGHTGNALVGVMTQWCTAGGSFVEGLMRRRLTEVEMYFNDYYSIYARDYYCYVVYDACGGKLSGLAQGYDCNLYATPMVTATREGYTFLGWYTAEVGGVKVTYLDENMHKMTLYAHWAEGSGEYDGGSDNIGDAVLATVTGDVVNVRKGPNTTYPVVGSVVRGDKVAITEVTITNGRLWGKFEKGWLCLEYTDYSGKTPDAGGGGSSSSKDEVFYEAPLYATVLSATPVTVYNGPHTSYPQLGTLKQWDEVLFVEVYKMYLTWYGRVEGVGWVVINDSLLVHDSQKLDHSVVVTVTNAYLNVRKGPGTDYGWLDQLVKGDQVEILSVQIIDGKVWGRYTVGWISLEYTDFDHDKLEQYWNHSYCDWYTVLHATCLSQGQERRDCLYCDDYETRETDLAPHIYGNWYTTENATCVTPGQERRDCELCDAFEEHFTQIIGHSYNDWYVAEEGNCVTKDLERRDCLHCDQFETREGEFGDHEMGQWYETVAPDLFVPGEERQDCTLCDHFAVKEIPALEHLFTDWYVTQDPTCTEVGEQRRDCTDCDHFETQEIAALGHDYDQWEVTVLPTCTEVGQRSCTCLRCGDVLTEELDALGHEMDEWAIVVDATCVTDGYRTRNCIHGDHEESEVIPATGHDMGQWYNYTDPTCTDEGEARRHCQLCNRTEFKVIPAAGHVYGDTFVHAAATCTQDGESRRQCKNCDHYVNKIIPATGHSLGDWYVHTEAVLGKNGEDRRDCQNCDHYESKETQCLTEVVTKTYATLTGNSYLNIRAGANTTYAAVGQLKRGDRVEILEFLYYGTIAWGRIEAGWIMLTGYMTLETVEETVVHVHSYGQWNTVKEATAQENGLERRDCVCGHFETREVEYVEYVTKTYGTLTGYSYLNIRAGAGSQYSQVGMIYYGNRVEILEITTVGAAQWGRVADGWVCITGYITLETVEEVVKPSEKPSVKPPVDEPHTHSFGDWYEQTAANCTTAGEQRRDCACGHYETQTIQATGHSFGAWYEHTKATCTTAGEQRRECACGHYERQSIQATGHSFGDWYTVTASTATTKGQERRDCACGHYETRETDMIVVTVTKTYGTLTGYTYLKIRAGLGTQYAEVGRLNYGDRVEILEVAAYSGSQWGRIAEGWICLTGYMTLETVVETVKPVEHVHSFGDWYEHTKATCTTAGEQRRECACGHYERQSIRATGHSFGDWYTVTASTTTTKGQERRDCACGHYETRETDYAAKPVIKVYATIIIDSLNVRSGAGTGYSRVGSVTYGTTHQVYEQVAVGNTIWGRIDAGWICLTGYTDVTNVEESTEPGTKTMTVVAAMLNVRSGAGTTYDVVAVLYQGNRVEVLETKVAGGITWARIAQGWVSMAYLA